MKRAIIIALQVVACTVAAFAQEDTLPQLSTKMAAFKDFCIRTANAAAVCDIDVLADCIDSWEPPIVDAIGNVKKAEMFIYKKELINYIKFGNLDTLDISQEGSTLFHFGFTPPAVDSWIANRCESVAIDIPSPLRDGPKHLEYTVQALKANSKATYLTRGGGQVEMFVVAESGGKINFSIHSVEKNFQGEIINEKHLSDNSGAQSAELVWTMERNGTIEFTVENVSDMEISFIVVKKL